MPLIAGARLGPFEIIAPLGAGGMGEVYRARDTRLQRTVAIKVLAASEQSARMGPERFQQEARAIARINHPGICALHDVGQEGPTTFLVMEYVEGETLSSRLAAGALPMPLAIRTAAQIAEALDHAHRQGVTHRDLKPANIMLTREGVKILDFGLAKLRDDPSRVVSAATTVAAPLTESGTTVGTVPYMSPEQVEGKAVDARSDIFSFGVVLYEMVTGRRPFTGDSRITLMNAIVTSEPQPPSAIQPVSPADLDRIVGRCLAKDPEARWQDARDLAAELRWLSTAGSGVKAGAVTAVPRRGRAAALVAATLAGAALVAVPMIVMLPRPAAVLPDFSLVTFRRGMVTSARFAPDGQSIVYSGVWQGGTGDVMLGRPRSADARSLDLPRARLLGISSGGDLAIRLGPQMVTPKPGTLARVPLVGGTRRDLMENVIDADWIPGTDDLAVVRLDDRGRSHVEFPVGTEVHETAAAWSMRVSPDGARIAFFDGPEIFGLGTNATLMVIDRTGRKSTLARDLDAIGLAWAPSSDEVWFTASRGPQAPSLWATTLSGRLRHVYRSPDWVVLYDIAPDGRVLLTRNSIRITLSCQLPGEPVERDLTWLISSQVHSLTADGKSVIFNELLGSPDPNVGQLYRRSLDGAPAVLLGSGLAVSLSPDDKWVLARVKGGLSLVPTGAGSVMTLPAPAARIGRAGWLDNRHIVFTGFAEPADAPPRVYVQSIADGTARPITGDGVTLVSPAPDGTSVLGRSGASFQFHQLEGGATRPVAGLRTGDVPIEWTRDGQALYVVDGGFGRATPSANVVEVDLNTGRRSPWKTIIPADPVGVDGIRSVAMMPDGSTYCYSYIRRLGDLYVAEGLK